MAKKSASVTDGQAKKSKPKDSNPARTAKEVRAYSRDFMEWAVKCQEMMLSAAVRMEQLDPSFEAVLITSMIDKYRGQIESRVKKQFGERNSKIAQDIDKERARRLLREIIARKPE